MKWYFLQGYVLGNPLTIRKEKNYKIPYAHGMGFISDELYEVIELYFCSTLLLK